MGYMLRLVVYLVVFVGMYLNRTLMDQRKAVRQMKRSPGKGLQDLPLLHNKRGGAANIIRIGERAAATGGAYFTFTELAHRGCGGFNDSRPGSPPSHIHWNQVETFVVREGVMMYEAGGKVGRAEPGEKVVVPAGVPHTWWAGDVEGWTSVEITLEPAGTHGELVFETLSGLARDYGSLEDVPKLQLVLWGVEQGTQFTFIPKPVWWIMENALVPLAKKIGYQPVYGIYATGDNAAAAEDPAALEQTPVVEADAGVASG